MTRRSAPFNAFHTSAKRLTFCRNSSIDRFSSRLNRHRRDKVVSFKEQLLLSNYLKIGSSRPVVPELTPMP